MPESPSNPYASPAEVVADQPKTDQQRRFTETSFAWLLVLTLNLPVPFACAFAIANTHAIIGATLLVVGLLIAGHLLMKSSPRLMRVFVQGGIVTAISQFFPLLQMIAGSIALDFCAQAGLAIPDGEDTIGSINTFAGGIMAAAITAGIVLCVAFGFGAFAWLWRLRKHESVEI